MIDDPKFIVTRLVLFSSAIFHECTSLLCNSQLAEMQFYGLRKCPSLDENNPAGCKQLENKENFRKVRIGEEKIEES